MLGAVWCIEPDTRAPPAAKRSPRRRLNSDKASSRSAGVGALEISASAANSTSTAEARSRTARSSRREGTHRSIPSSRSASARRCSASATSTTTGGTSSWCAVAKSVGTSTIIAIRFRTGSDSPGPLPGLNVRMIVNPSAASTCWVPGRSITSRLRRVSNTGCSAVCTPWCKDPASSSSSGRPCSIACHRGPSIHLNGPSSPATGWCRPTRSGQVVAVEQGTMIRSSPSASRTKVVFPDPGGPPSAMGCPVAVIARMTCTSDRPASVRGI